MQCLSSNSRARRAAGRTTKAVLRAVVCSLALALMILVVPIGLSATARTTPKPEEKEPLGVHLESISPSTLSDNDRPLTITGTVTNQSDEQWTAINLYSFRSEAPIPDAQSLADSAAIETAAFVGTRIVAAGTEDTVELLDPGESAPFSLTVPRSEIRVVEPGVYWLGVHAMGIPFSSLERDLIADGRARTFIPLVPRARGKDKDEVTVESAIVVPVRETVWFQPDGRIAHLARWTRSLGDGGRLDAILDAGEAADVPLTWLVDPAVPAAVKRLADGNPPRSLAPDPNAPPPSEEPTEEPSEPTGAPVEPEPFAAFSDPIPPPVPEEELSDRQQALADQAQEWLDRFLPLASSGTVLALPYGDIDESAAATHGPAFYQQAVTRSTQVMAGLAIPATPALAPRDGIMSPAAIAAASPETMILLGDTTSFTVPPDSASSMVDLLGHKVLVTSSGAAAGGPGPTPADDPLALRQRLLSEAALRLLTASASGPPAPTPPPVVMMLPADWHPEEPDALLADLDVPWLSAVSAADIALRPATSISVTDIAYSLEDAEAELDETSFTAAEELTARAQLLSGVLTLQDLVREQVADEVLVSLSSGHRSHADDVTQSVQEATGFIDAQLGKVRVEAPDAVTLSSQTGPFGADVVNGLDQPVTVRLAVDSGGTLELADLGPQQLGPGAKKRILPQVTASRPGIHQVSLLVTDADGQPTGASTSLQVRAAQVSGLIWLILAGGALLLFGTIALRLVKRLRARRASPPGATALAVSP
ncbi:DUF6049 family protein [Nocardioides sp.]|uniref:DUF6049 family protein n=1 Tax=Nocardioides sp. TaxID=35761 RepID=UPI002CBC58E7|nr:DUF6049 family protein [Nocardioides sp.]HXH81020.1 DUF6049 family protein [Nocardioides sp.]